MLRMFSKWEHILNCLSIYIYLKGRRDMDSIRSKRNGDTVTVMLRGEIDHCSVDAIRNCIERMISPAEIKHMHLDFTDVSFMDSSGIGMIIGRYKTMRTKDGIVSASGMNPPVDRLFHMAGLHRIIRIEPAQTEE